MSRIRGKDTKIEIKMEKILKKTGYKFEKHPEMYGNPDFAHKRKRIAIFCDGDFWHGYPISTPAIGVTSIPASRGRRVN